MRTKQVIALLSGSILFLTSGMSVFAVSPLESLGSAFESIQQSRIFQNFYGRFASGEAGAIFWAKFLIWVLLFAILDYGLSFVFKENRKTAHIVAGILSLISVIAIPSVIMLTIFQTYSTVVSFILLLIPVVIVIFLHILTKRALQNNLRIAHLVAAVLTLILFGITTAMFSAFRSVQVPSATGESFFAMVGNSPFAVFIYAALLIWAVIDIVLALFGGTASAKSTIGGVFGKGLGMIRGDTPAIGRGSDPMDDLHRSVDDVGASVGRRAARSVSESREERRILSAMRGLESESVGDVDKIERDLDVLESELEAIKSAPDLTQKQNFLRQVQAGIQKIVPEHQHIQEHLGQLELDLSLLIRLERGQYKELSKDNVETQEIDRILQAHPNIDSNNMKKIRKKIRNLLKEKTILLQRQYMRTGQERNLFKQLELKLRSFQTHMGGIVTALNSGFVDQSINHVRSARNDMNDVKQLWTKATTRNGQIARRVDEFLHKDKLNKLISKLTRS